MSLLAHWRQFHQRHPVARWATKLALFGAVTLLVLFPRLWLVPTWLARLTDLNAVVDADARQLALLEREVRTLIPPEAPLPVAAEVVQKVVYTHLPYAFDWETWGVVDYLPTPAEALERGQEDCDGRAVVAAALLRRMGYEAVLVTDLKHMWVAARDRRDANRLPYEFMHPGVGAHTFVGEAGGTHATWVGLAGNAVRGLAFGVAVFPLGRELIIVGAICLLTLHPRATISTAACGCGLLLIALLLLRTGGDPSAGAPVGPLCSLAGMVAGVLGWVLLALRVAARDRPSGPVE